MIGRFIDSKSSWIVFLTALIFFAWLTAPDMTWINTDSDGVTYLAASKYLVLSHPTGAPLFNLINAAVVRIPIPHTTEFWRLAIISAIASAGTATLLYKISKNVFPPLLFLASGIVVSQSTIVETYALLTLIMVGTYYLHKTGHHNLKYIAIAIGLSIHHLPGIMIIPLAITDYMNHRSLKSVLFIFLGLIPYAYIPVFNRAPYHWIEGSNLHNYYDYFTGQTGLVGGLAYWPPQDLILRLQDFFWVLIGGFGLILPMIAFVIYQKRQDGTLKELTLLASLVLLPVVYYLTTMPPQTYVYVMPAIAFATLIAYQVKTSYVTSAFAVALIGIVVVNMLIYDIGNTLDPSLSATRYYRSLDKLENNSVVAVDSRGWEAATINLYNYDHPDRNIQVRGWNIYPSPEKQEQLTQDFTNARLRVRLYKSQIIKPEQYYSVIIPWSPSDDEIKDYVSPRVY